MVDALLSGGSAVTGVAVRLCSRARTRMTVFRPSFFVFLALRRSREWFKGQGKTLCTPRHIRSSILTVRFARTARLKSNITEVTMFKARPSTRVVRLGSPGDSDKHTNCMEVTAGKQQSAGKRALSGARRSLSVCSRRRRFIPAAVQLSTLAEMRRCGTGCPQVCKTM